MFTNLIESDSHRKEFKRRSSFFLATTAAYSLILFAAAVAGVLLYDAKVEAQNTDLLINLWIPPVKTDVNRDTPRDTRQARRPTATNAPVDPNLTVQMRTSDPGKVDPLKAPEFIATSGVNLPPATGPIVIGPKNADPPGLPPGDGGTGNCTNCTGTGPNVHVDTGSAPAPVPIKPKVLTSSLLMAKAVSLPKPVYPSVARQVHLEGAVNVQILVDEHGKVVSARAVKGNPVFLKASEDAALRARFTPTLLGNQPVKVQGVITYNFSLQ
ncbi:MAG TPA: energy transducer TonB [Pyrinomonadaceae bacterium]|nr:energy transducer TonB [Pyrinomonadaceae bacterium]